MGATGWKRAPKRGYVICPHCFAIVEDKGFKQVQHLVSKACQDAREPALSLGDAAQEPK